VTGGCGFIGAWLVRSLSAAGARVTVVDDLSTGRAESVAGLPGVRVVVGSVLDAPLLRRLGGEATFVFHLAGIVGMRLAMAETAAAHRITVDGTANVLAATGDAPALLFSSSAVYGQGRPGESADERWPIRLEDLRAYDGGRLGYAAGKWELERLGAEARAAGRACLSVRPFNVVGPGQSAAYGMVLPRFMAAARAGEDLCVYDDGRQTRCFTDVRSFVRHLLALATTPRAYEVGPINLGNPDSIAILDLARLVVEATGSRSEIRFEPYASVFPGRTDVRHRRPRVERAASLVGTLDWAPISSVVRELAAS